MKKFKLQNRAFQKSFSVTFFITLSSFHRQVTYDIIKIVRSAMDLNVYDFIDDDVSDRHKKK
jgi:hypothetical protein